MESPTFDHRTRRNTDGMTSTDTAKCPTPPPLLSVPKNLFQLLTRASSSNSDLVFISPQLDDFSAQRISYSDLLADAKAKACLVRSIPGITSSPVILLHFDTQYDVITWFWAVTISGLLPAISTPLVNDETQRRKHLLHLQSVLINPIILTSGRLVPEFLHINCLRVYAVETLHLPNNGLIVPDSKAEHPPEDSAVLMLTSGSTGQAKAVPLRHGQIIKSLQGKSRHHRTVQGDVFLNWVGLDHVASLVEIHLHAMFLHSDQVHVPASRLLQDPLSFVSLFSQHQVSYTFAPNFFLAMVSNTLNNLEGPLEANLAHLNAIISGGEPNVVITCDTLTSQLTRLGADGKIIRPGFGMTETCAGCIYSHSCHSSDMSIGHEIAHLGTAVSGMQMRIMKDGVLGTVGALQVKGPVVFDSYFNNAKDTSDAFTLDGWFITGDLAWIDECGHLNLAGRSKDTIIINGVKWSSTELEKAIDEECAEYVRPSFTVVFPCRPRLSPTEEVAVVYSFAFDEGDDRSRYEASKVIAKTVSLITSRRAAHIIPLPAFMLGKSSLGKVSRARLRDSLERGDYAAIEEEDSVAINRYAESVRQGAKTKTEIVARDTLMELLGIPSGDISVDVSVFDLGVDSLNLILLKKMLQEILDTTIEIPMSLLLTNPNVGGIAFSIDTLLGQPLMFNPIVPLQTNGTKTPLFCIHPGSGDVLVFIALAAHFPTRPVYAVRTRGYNPGERCFTSIQEAAETYARHIRVTQPEGPYAIAGYSLGSTLAYEVAKVLESQSQEVRFLASIDYPPHISQYVRNLNWTDVLLHTACFLELINEHIMAEITPYLHGLNHTDAVQHVLSVGDVYRARSLAIDATRMHLIADIAENFRVNAQTYEPTGTVDTLDVFVADPPTYAARDRQDWRENKLGRWADFVRRDAGFPDCPGIHARMLNREHMADFARIFKSAMKRRGV